MSGPGRLVLTLSDGALSGLEGALEPLGIQLSRVPLVSFGPPVDDAPFASAVGRLETYGAVALTSRRAAAIFAERVRAAEHVPACWATGVATGLALRGFRPLNLVQGPVPEGAALRLADAMVAAGVRGPVLFPCGERHRGELPDRLRQAGVQVEEVVCYRAVIGSMEEARGAAAMGDVIAVGSGMVAELLASAVAGDRPPLVALGESTARAAAAAGWPPAAVADEPTAAALIPAVHQAFRMLRSVTS